MSMGTPSSTIRGGSNKAELKTMTNRSNISEQGKYESEQHGGKENDKEINGSMIAPNVRKTTRTSGSDETGTSTNLGFRAISQEGLNKT